MEPEHTILFETEVAGPSGQINIRLVSIRSGHDRSFHAWAEIWAESPEPGEPHYIVHLEVFHKFAWAAQTIINAVWRTNLLEYDGTRKDIANGTS